MPVLKITHPSSWTLVPGGRYQLGDFLLVVVDVGNTVNNGDGTNTTDVFYELQLTIRGSVLESHVP